MKTYSFAYGSGTVELPLDEKKVIGELHGNAVAPLADIRAALWASLDAPIDSAPLCERARAGDTVALVVSDMTRFWMRQDLLVEQNAGKALAVADRAYVLEQGRITLSGTGADLAASDAVKKAYLGG